MKTGAKLCLGLLLLFNVAFAQKTKVDHLSQAQLEETAKSLRDKARAGSGSAATTFQEYGPDKTMLSVRTKSGGAEVHAEYADFFVILHGHATLLNGGKMVDGQTKSPGETLGKGLEGSDRVEINAGDVVHIPPGVPHQLLLNPGETLEYLVIKVKEAPGGSPK